MIGKKKMMIIPSGETLSSNIISEFKFENNVLDTAGNNNGTATDITYGVGLVGSSAIFNGTTSQVSFGDANTLNGIVDCTVSFLAKRTVNMIGKVSAFDYGTYTSWGNFQLSGTTGSFFWTPNDTTQFRLAEMNNKFVLNEWRHVIIRRTYNPNENISGFSNGILTHSANSGGTAPKQSTAPFLIGNGYIGNWLGEIENFRIWNIALSNEQCLDIAAQELAGIDINP